MHHRLSKKLLKRVIAILSVTTMSCMFTSYNMAGVSAYGANPSAPINLKINLIDEPYGIPVSDPSFSWVCNDSDKNEIQTAYQILIASTADKINSNVGDVADTGMVVSNESSYVKIANLNLQPNSIYFWKVRTWDKDGNVSPYSAPQTFTTEVGDAWAGKNGIWSPVVSDPYAATGWTDYALECTIKISASALGICFRATNGNKDMYMWQFKTDDNTLNVHNCKNGQFNSLESVSLSKYGITLKTNTEYNVKIVAVGDNVVTYINDVCVDNRTVSDFSKGVIGFRTGSRENGTVSQVLVYKTDSEGNKGDILYSTDFSNGVNDFSGGSVSNGVLSVPIISNFYLVNSGIKMQNGNFVFLRNTFNIANRNSIEKAIVSVTATSPDVSRSYVYNLYLNGSFVGMGPAQAASYSQRVSDSTATATKYIQYNTYDVTDLLKNGENVIGSINYATSGRMFLLQMTVFYKDGKSEILLNSSRDMSNWKALDGTEIYGENNSVGTSYYTQAAENINALKFPFGWNESGYDDSEWISVVDKGLIDAESSETTDDITTKTVYVLTPAQTENMSRYYLDVASIVDKGNGNYLIDLGKEIIGGICLNVNSDTSKAITVRYGEELSGENTVKYQMRTGNKYEEKWTLKTGEQKLESLGMKTFRYVEILNSPVTITSDNIKGVAVRQKFNDDDSYFNSSDPDLNRIYEFCKYSIKATNQNLYVDSQSRERCAYEGDALINMMSSYAVSDNRSLARYSIEYLNYNSTWPAEYKLESIIMAWYDYLYTGNMDSLKKYYDVLKTDKLFDDMFNTEYNLLKRPNSADGKWDSVLVDWPAAERDGYEFTKCTYNTVFNAIGYAAYNDLAKIAEVLGKTEDAKEYANKASLLKTAMNNKLYDPDKGLFYDGLNNEGSAVEHYSQHASAFPLAMEVVDDENAKQSIAAYIKENGIKTSVYGAYFVLSGLYQADAGDVAMDLITAPATTTRSWLHIIDSLNATISTEAWDPSIKSNMTYSHPWGSSPVSQIVTGMFGVNPLTAGFSKFQVKYQPGDVQSAEIKVPTVKGAIELSYDTKNSKYAFYSTAKVPVNTTAVVYIPAPAASAALVVDGVLTQAERSGNYLAVELGSGEHTVALPPINVSLTFSDSDENLVGGSKKLTVAINGIDGNVYSLDNATVTFTSDNEEIATVDQTGTVKFNKAGEATIMATVKIPSITIDNRQYDNVEITGIYKLNVITDTSFEPTSSETTTESSTSTTGSEASTTTTASGSANESQSPDTGSKGLGIPFIAFIAAILTIFGIILKRPKSTINA